MTKILFDFFEDVSKIVPAILFVLTLLGILIGKFKYKISWLQPLEKIAHEQKEYRKKNQQQDLISTIAERHILIGNEFLSIGNLSAAKIEFKASLNVDSTNNEAALGLFKSQILDYIDKSGYSPEVLKKKIDLLFRYNSEDAHGYYFLGILHRQINPTIAMDYFKKAINANPIFPDAYYQVGVIYDFEDGFDSALALSYYEKAVSLSEFNQNYLNNLSYKYLQKDMFEKAIATYERLTKIDKTDLLPYLMMSKCLLRVQKLNEAIGISEQFIKVLKLNPSSLEEPLNSSVWAFSVADNHKVKLSTQNQKLLYAYLSSFYMAFLKEDNLSSEKYIAKCKKIISLNKDEYKDVRELIDFEICNYLTAYQNQDEIKTILLASLHKLL